MICPDKYNDFIVRFYRFMANDFRFGQAFVNEFVQDVGDPDLFYEEDHEKAKTLAWEKYVNVEEACT